MKRVYPVQPIVGVAAVVLCDGKVLLEKRRNDPGKGQWSIPGGLIELGEKTKMALVREVKEETGLDVQVLDLIDVFDNLEFDDEGRLRYHFVIIDYLAKLKTGMLKASSDAEDLRWVELGEIEDYDLTKSFRSFYERNKQRLTKLAKHSQRIV